MQILAFKSRPWWSSSNASCQERLAKQSQDTTGDQVPFETTWRSHSSAICRHGLGKDNRIATRYCKTHRCDAPVRMHKVSQHMQTTIELQHTTVQHIALIPMHKVSQHMQNTIAQHQQRREKSHLEPSVASCAHFERDSTAKRRPRRPSHAQACFSPPRNLRLPEKITRFRANPSIQIASMMEQFQCELPRTTCKTIQSQDTTGDQVAFETPWCSHSSAIM